MFNRDENGNITIHRGDMGSFKVAAEEGETDE